MNVAASADRFADDGSVASSGAIDQFDQTLHRSGRSVVTGRFRRRRDDALDRDQVELHRDGREPRHRVGVGRFRLVETGHVEAGDSDRAVGPFAELFQLDRARRRDLPTAAAAVLVERRQVDPPGQHQEHDGEEPADGHQWADPTDERNVTQHRAGPPAAAEQEPPIDLQAFGGNEGRGQNETVARRNPGPSGGDASDRVDRLEGESLESWR